MQGGRETPKKERIGGFASDFSDIKPNHTSFHPPIHFTNIKMNNKKLEKNKDFMGDNILRDEVKAEAVKRAKHSLKMMEDFRKSKIFSIQLFYEKFCNNNIKLNKVRLTR